jgi:hypothetical protein
MLLKTGHFRCFPPIRHLDRISNMRAVIVHDLRREAFTTRGAGVRPAQGRQPIEDGSDGDIAEKTGLMDLTRGERAIQESRGCD